jgi:pimeloyl-ACP methyl ester carboxylesterase
MTEGRLVDIGDTQLFVVEREAGYPVIVLHGGPGLDHRMFGDYLDALTDTYKLILVDHRANGRSGRPLAETWTLQQNARDVGVRPASSLQPCDELRRERFIGREQQGRNHPAQGIPKRGAFLATRLIRKTLHDHVIQLA